LVQRRGPPFIGLCECGAVGRRQAEESERGGLRGHGGDDIPQAMAPSQLGADERADLAPSAERPARATGTRLVVQGLDLRSGHHLSHLAKDRGTMGHGSNPPEGLNAFAENPFSQKGRLFEPLLNR
jgi:hypothetical protein